MTNVVFGRRNLSGSSPVVSRAAGAVRRPDAPVESAQPARPAASPSKIEWSWRLILMMLAFPAVWLGMIIYQGPPLLRDYRLAGSFQYDFTVKVENAKCTAYLFILKTCSVDYRILDAEPSAVRSTNFMVAFAGTEGKVVAPMRSTIDRDAVTTQIALEWMTNRIITFFTLTVGMLALMIAFISKLTRSGSREDAEFAASPPSA